LDHSTAFEVEETMLTESGASGTRVQRLTTTAHDPIADLRLAVEIELTASGLARARGTLTSTGTGSSEAVGSPTPYGLEALTIAWPVPRVATEIQDYTGRWIRERTVQRTAFTV